MAYDYVGNAIKAYNSGTGWYGQKAPNNAAQSSGPYDMGSPLGTGYQAQNYNLVNSGNVQSISDLVNSINLQAQKTANQARVPNNPALEAQSSKVIGQELQGQLPSDVVTMLAQQAAERGVGAGIPGSDNSNAALLRSLGLNSLQQIQAGQQNLSAADARNPAAPLYDPTSQILTPYQGAQIQLSLNSNNLGASQILAQQQQAAASNALKQQALNQQAYQYANSNLNYGSPNTGNTFDNSNLFPTSNAYSGGDASGSSWSYNTSPSSYYDYNPSPSIDYSSGYADTPVSMYG